MKNLLILVTLVLSFVLTSCGWNRESEVEEANKITDEIVNEESWNDTTEESSSAGKKQTMAECMNGCEMIWKQNPWNKDKWTDKMKIDCDNLCNASIWIQNNDLELCEKSGDVLLKWGCYTEVAKSKKDVNICDKISDHMIKQACYSSVAEDTKDFKACDKITDSIFKDSCVEWVKNN